MTEQRSILGHAYALQSRVWLAKGSFELAEERARAALEQIAAAEEASSAHEAIARLYLGESLSGQGRYDEAEAELLAAVEDPAVAGNRRRSARARRAIEVVRAGRTVSH